MRFIEFMIERDKEDLASKLQALIDHPSTPEHERASAKEKLSIILGKETTPRKVGRSDLPDFSKPYGRKPKVGQKVDIKV